MISPTRIVWTLSSKLVHRGSKHPSCSWVRPFSNPPSRPRADPLQPTQDTTTPSCRTVRKRQFRMPRMQARMDSLLWICRLRKLSSSERFARRRGTFPHPLFVELFADVLCSISYVPLVAPSTSIGRVKFLAGIADSFIYVVSKVRLSAPLLNTLLIHPFRWEPPVQPVTQQ
jgi:hypothetical protein